MLKPGLKESFQNRISAITSPPVLSSVLINSGDVTTTSPNVLINIQYSGATPTHYMISELTDFSDATW